MRSVATTCLFMALAAACARRFSPGDVATDAAAGPARRECRDNAACGASAYCEFAPGLCGKGYRPGTCRPKPASCPGAYEPACGCDGKVYPSECAARSAGVDVAVMGGCKASIPDYMACGQRFCDAHTSYCEIYLSDVFEIPTTYHCRTLPPACLPDDGGTRTCGCFPAGTPCLSFCGTILTNGLQGFHLTCQGVKEPLR